MQTKCTAPLGAANCTFSGRGGVQPESPRTDTTKKRPSLHKRELSRDLRHYGCAALPLDKTEHPLLRGLALGVALERGFNLHLRERIERAGGMAGLW